MNTERLKVLEAIKNNVLMDFITSNGHRLDKQDLIDIIAELAYTVIGKTNRLTVIDYLIEKWEGK